MDHLLADLRHAVRGMLNNPVFTVIAIASLAVGIGTNTAFYALYRGVFSSDRGFANPATLVKISVSQRDDQNQVSFPEFGELRDRSRSVLSDVAAYSAQIGLVETADRSDTVFLEAVSGNYFDLLGVRPVVGRGFVSGEDDVIGAPAVAVLGHATWLQRFQGAPDVVGKTLKVNGVAFTIVGVAPAAFNGMFPFAVEFWVPISQIGVLKPNVQSPFAPDRRVLYLAARLAPGVGRSEASAAVDVISARMFQGAATAADRTRRAGVIGVGDVAMEPEIDRTIKLLAWFLMGMVGLVLLVACANFAAVLTARAAANQRQTAIRLALGSGRWRLIRSLLTESLLLSGLGCLGGLVLARWVIGLILALHPPLPLTIDLRVEFDWHALAFAVGLAFATGLVFGLLPARACSSSRLMGTLKGAASGRGVLPRRLSLGNGLILGQVVISTVLLLCAGLLVRSLALASSVDRGFDLEHGLIFQLPLKYRVVAPARSLALLEAVQQQLSAIPGVDSVCVASNLPLGFGQSGTRVQPVGTSVAVPDRGVWMGHSEVDTAYFRTLGIRLVSGRVFTDADGPNAPRVAVVNQRFADRYWPNQSPIGRQIREGKTLLTIVGVAQNGKYSTLGESDTLYLYRPLRQTEFRSRMLSVVIRTRTDPAGVTVAVRQALRSIDSGLPLFDLKTVSEHLGITLYLPRLLGTVAAGLGLIVLLLGATGLFGVLSYDASRRTREIGIRMAVGARARDVVAQMVGKAVWRVAAGIGIGMVLTALASRGLEAVLIGVSRVDPIAYVAVAALLLIVSVAAAARPARWAANVDPIQALRQD